MFRKVRDAVLASTGGRQEPFIYSSLSGKDTYLAAVPEPAKTTTVIKPGDDEPVPEDLTQKQGPTTQAELLFWESVKDSQHAADIEAYLAQYPSGTYATLAQNRLARLAPSPPSNDQSAVIELDDRPQLPTKGTWETRYKHWTINLKIDDNRLFAILKNRTTGLDPRIRCVGNIDSVGTVEARCRRAYGPPGKLEGVFPNLRLVGIGSVALFSFDR